MKYVFCISVVLFIVYLFIGKVELGGISLLLFIISGAYLLCKKIWKLCHTHKETIQQKPFAAKLKITTGDTDGAYYCKIAGVQYRNSAQDIGGFLGYISSEPENPHDKNAIAIYRNDNKLVGYIPKDETANFREWSGKENLPCIGFIKAGDAVPLFGKVKVIDSDSEETKLLIAKYVRWLVSTFGVKFIPAGFSVDAEVTPKTKKEWLDVLDYYIEKMDNELYEEI